MDILASLDIWDWIILGALGLGLFYYLYQKYAAPRKDEYSPSFVPMSPSGSSMAGSKEGDSSFVSKMRHGNRTVCIFYGSQTGTAEEFAGRLAKEANRFGLKAIVLDPEECDMEILPEVSEIEQNLAIFCVATYGEGDPTDNCQELHEMLQRGDADLQGINYAVFGLGNKTYEHYNFMGKSVDTALLKMGAKKVHDLGLGDDDGNLEEDFMRWKEGFWPAVCTYFDLHAVGAEELNMRQYKLTILEDFNANSIFRGEITRLGSFERQRPPFDHKNPFMAGIVVNRELHAGGSRSCKHVEFDLTDSRLRYEAGDHAAVFPQNDPELVEKIGQMLSVDLDTVFTLTNLDEESSKKHPFPCPCTYRTALTFYVDLTYPLRSHVLRELSNYATDEKEKSYLQLLSTASEEGLHEYHSYIHQPRRSIIDILQEFRSCQPELDHLLELLSRLQARYYSISSSPKADAKRLSITAVVVDYTMPGNRRIKGVATNYLALKEPAGEMAHKVPIFIRKSALRLPHKSNVPVIMIGPGTGLAPFRGFLQDRQASKEHGLTIGPTILYFGCRNRAEDYIYKEELEQWVESGVLTQLHVAFSREHTEKVYVQHQLWDNRDYMWQLMDKDGAHIYVCGDARHMARDVQNTLLRICTEVGGMEQEKAEEFIALLEKQKRIQADVWS